MSAGRLARAKKGGQTKKQPFGCLFFQSKGTHNTKPAHAGARGGSRAFKTEQRTDENSGQPAGKKLQK
ncbi:MAG: hypothetical protein LBG83_06555, partial [Oscillospiraceae bacterium]|nr:hypothetical protein [Oscillospiraceae bacterium]